MFPEHPANEPARSLRLSIIEGAVFAAHFAIVNGALLTGYAIMLGANDFHLGLLNGMWTLAAFGSVAGTQQLGRSDRRKPMMLEALTLSRSVWICLCLLPFLPISPLVRIALFLVIVLTAATAAEYANMGWMSWMTDLVPPAIRGRYFSWRNSILGASGMLTGCGAGWVCDQLKLITSPANAFVPVLVFAVACGTLSTLLLARIWEPPLHGERPLPLLQTLRLPLRHGPFRHLLILSGLWALVTGVAAPFFQPQMIKNLHMSFAVIGLYAAIAGIVNLAAQPLWGILIDRIGNRPVLLMNIIGVTGLPLLWLLARPDCLMPIWIDAALTGIFWPGILLTFFNLVMITAPQENRSAYLASYRLVTGLVGFAGALLGGGLAYLLRDFSLPVAGQCLVNFHMLFVLSCVGRFALWPLVRHLKEPPYTCRSA
ncbi:MAG: MFS transporter [bacterium]